MKMTCGQPLRRRTMERNNTSLCCPLAAPRQELHAACNDHHPGCAPTPALLDRVINSAASSPPLCTWIVRLTAPYSDWGPFYVLTTPTLHQPGWGLLQLSICAWTCLLGHSCGWRTQAAGASSTAGPSGVGVSTTKFNPSPTPFDQIKSVEAVTLSWARRHPIAQ